MQARAFMDCGVRSWCVHGERERTSSSAHECSAARRNANQAGVCTHLVKHTGRSHRRDVRLDEDPAQCGDCQHTSDPDGATAKFGHGCRTLHFRFVKEHTHRRVRGSEAVQVGLTVVSQLMSISVAWRLAHGCWAHDGRESWLAAAPWPGISCQTQVKSIHSNSFSASKGWPRQWWWWSCWQRWPS
jgi:predicted Zn-ribbon and HTH transcriptional regulator